MCIRDRAYLVTQAFAEFLVFTFGHVRITGPRGGIGQGNDSAHAPILPGRQRPSRGQRQRVCSIPVETMTPEQISQRIAVLRAEHRSLDEDISRLAANPDDDLESKRLKKRKLQLRDCITKLESMLIPNEPA